MLRAAMLSKSHVAAWSTCCSICVALLLGGCSDARGRFQAFEDRRAQLDTGSGGETGEAGASSGGAEGCAPPPPNAVQGPALLALETTTSPGKAILFFGQVTTPELDGKTAVEYHYRAIDAHDRRTELGDQLQVGPYPISDDGTFDAPAPRAVLPGGANALLPGADIDSELTLHGTICGVKSFYCGTVTGQLYAPFEGPASGQFGLILIDSIDDVPDRPRFGCAEDALAPALE